MNVLCVARVPSNGPESTNRNFCSTCFDRALEFYHTDDFFRLYDGRIDSAHVANVPW